MADFLTLDTVLIKISDIKEITLFKNDPNRILVTTHSSNTLTKPGFEVDYRYLQAALYQAAISPELFISFEDAYNFAEEIFELDKTIIEKGYCEECSEDEDLCSKNH